MSINYVRQEQILRKVSVNITNFSPYKTEWNGETTGSNWGEEPSSISNEPSMSLKQIQYNLAQTNIYIPTLNLTGDDGRSAGPDFTKTYKGRKWGLKIANITSRHLAVEKFREKFGVLMVSEGKLNFFWKNRGLHPLQTFYRDFLEGIIQLIES